MKYLYLLHLFFLAVILVVCGLGAWEFRKPDIVEVKKVEKEDKTFKRIVQKGQVIYVSPRQIRAVTGE